MSLVQIEQKELYSINVLAMKITLRVFVDYKSCKGNSEIISHSIRQQVLLFTE